MRRSQVFSVVLPPVRDWAKKVEYWLDETVS
jgi:hypothetical protein